MSVIRWALNASAHIGGNSRLRWKFIYTALRNRSVAQQMERLDPMSPLGGLFREWPETAGFLMWPYQCCAWDAKTRFERIQGHLDVLSTTPGLALSPDEKLILADLGDVSTGAKLVIDRPKWLSREGHLTLSLFKDNFRAFTVSFSLWDTDDLQIVIGGIQGRNDENILDLYRDLTKDFHGMRPRDFILEALRMFATKIGAKHIYAVAEDQKISRHAYFRRRGSYGLVYDDIWLERGGSRVADTHFELPIAPARRPLDDIQAKKRSMYRRRYEMLDNVIASLPDDLRSARRIQFVDR